jgi:MFS family permease
MACRKWPLIFGLFALAASTALLCAGTSMALWVTGRIFQGMSAAIVWTVGIALLVDSYGIHEIGSAMGYVGMSFSLGNMSGPLLGGVIYQKCGYYAVFILTFAFIGVDIAFRLVMIEPKDVHKWLDEPAGEIATREASPDCANLETLQVVSKESETCALAKYRSLSSSHPENTESENAPCSSPPSKRHLASLFVLLKSSRMWLALFSYFVISILMTSFDSVLPIFVHDTFGWNQTGEGLVFVPLCLPHFMEPLWGRLGDRHRYVYRLFAAGAFFSLVPVLVLLRLVSSNTVGHQALLCTLLALVGICFSLALPPTMTEVTHVLNDIKTKSPDAFGKNGAVAQAYGLMNCAFAMGSLIGPVWAGFVREEYGWGAMSWTLGLLSGVTAVPVLLGLGGWIGKMKQADRHRQGQEPDNEVQISH